ncbi:hypothetical protein NXS19_013334 [Fusarium pseudograminearum]|nr:hypothetical protein NXS19_013334 [Fusarium pseudograminearum]
MGRMGEAANLRARESENDATRGLVNTYSTLDSATPIRTPRAPEQEDHIANEIRNIRALNDTKSALLGGENTPLHEGASSTGFDGIAPRKQTISTPNPLATPMRGDNVAATPGRPGQTPMRTPRDTLSLNQDGGMSMVSATPRDMRMRDLALRNQLKSGLASLPKPKDIEWEFDIPDEEKERMQVDEMTEEDAAERDRREQERRQVEEALEFRRRTQVMQKNLPRPAHVNLSNLMKQASSITDVAESLIAKESANLMANDAMRYPVPGGQVSGAPKPLQQFSDNALSEARLLILSEARPLPKFEAIQTAFEGRASSSLLLGLGCYNDDDEEEQGVALKAAFDAVQDDIMATAEAGAKLEKKLSLHLGGYQKRQKMLRDKMGDASDALEKARVALVGFKTLAISEDVAVERRLGALREEVGFVNRREREAQENYRKAKEELDTLMDRSKRGALMVCL